MSAFLIAGFICFGVYDLVIGSDIGKTNVAHHKTAKVTIKQ